LEEELVRAVIARHSAAVAEALGTGLDVADGIARKAGTEQEAGDARCRERRRELREQCP